MIEKLRLSPNSQPRNGIPITAIVMHTTGGGTAEGTLSWFEQTESRVSSHVVIDKDGTIWRCVPDDQIAWHAGKSQLWRDTRVNLFSLSVELVGVDVHTYPPAQLDAAAQWVAEKSIQFQVPLNRIVGHADVALPYGRKTDPENFPWHQWLVAVAGRMSG